MDIYNISELTEKEIAGLWLNASFVYDTSALCGLYDLTDHYRQIMIEILEYFKTRSWIPHQVKVEYNRNREKSIHNPIFEQYKDPSVIKCSFVTDTRKMVAQWEKSEYFHPYLDVAALKTVKEAIEEANKHIRLVKDTIKAQYEKRREEINNIVSHDFLLDWIETLAVGEPMSMTEMLALVQEGTLRYHNQIPPGYRDEEKEGIRKFGDLIIWKGIIDYSVKHNTDIIFVSNDLKDDWLEADGARKGKLRAELVAEFEEQTSHHILHYSMKEFIEALKNQYHDSSELPLYDELENVVAVLHRISMSKYREHGVEGEKMIIRCEHCGGEFEVWSDELDLEWDRGISAERGMGPEFEWNAETYTRCPHCNSDVHVAFDIYEYPIGAYNWGNVECEGGEVLNDPDLSKICPIEECFEDHDYCEKCGTYAHLNSYGFCRNCEAEFERFINSDD